MLDLVIFSKDRACQLELLLRSLKHRFANWTEVNISILYTFSDADYGAAYALVRAVHPEFSYVCEHDTPSGFRELTLSLLGGRPYTMFLVDDDVFKEEFRLDSPEFQTFAATSEIMCLSLRMAPYMDYCYPRDTAMVPPPFAPGNIWDWTTAEYDWHYPMSVDGNVFRTAELLPVVHSIQFHNPNTFEAEMAARPLPNAKMICFSESRVINLPVNRVQDTAPNRAGTLAARWMNDEFVAGRRLSEATVTGVRNRGPHEEVPLVWESWDPPEMPVTTSSPKQQQQIVVMLAEEAFANPDLLAGYLHIVDANANAKLILFAPDSDPNELGPRLAALAGETGLDQPGSAEVEALAVPRESGLEALLTAAHAVLSDRDSVGELDGLPRYGSATLPALAQSIGATGQL